MGEEKKIETKVCEYARQRGFLTPKINVIGERGWPDRIFIDPEGWHVYVEFKAPGKTPEPIQTYRHGELIKRGIVVIIIDDEEQGKQYVDDMVSARVSEEGDEPSIIAGVSGPIPGSGSREN